MYRPLVALAVAAVLAVPALVRADAASCTKTIGKETGKYLKSRLKAVSKCEDSRANGKLAPGTVCRPQCDSASTDPGAPCRSNSDCPGGTCLAVTDPTASGKLSSAVTKTGNKITDACNLMQLPPIGPACDDALPGAAGLAACVTAPRQDDNVKLLNADTLAELLYATTAPVDPTLVKCHAAISKEVGKYFFARYKEVEKCNEQLAKGKITGPCPDSGTVAKIETKRAKLDAGIRKKCTEAQIAATVAPKLSFGEPCEQFLYVTYKRDTSTTSTTIPNTIPALDRLIKCVTDATAAAVDRSVAIGYPGTEGSAFTYGVTAGDATDTAAIFWTRFPDSTQGGLLDVATNQALTMGLQTVSVPTPTPGDDGTVKVEVTLLTPYTEYFYRFRQGTNTSAVGRVKTLPSPGATQSFRVGWTGDANAFFRPYTVLDPIRLQNVDAWFFIGDTIYGDDPRADGVVSVSKQDYYGKYKANLSDRPLRQMLESTGTYVMWDDHESRNDVAGTVPAFATKVANGNHAFRKYWPIREDTGDPQQLYRSFKFGTLAEFFIIDLRQYRSAKYTCCNLASDNGYVLTDTDTTCTTGDLALPDAGCNAALATPGRTVLGATQKAWLKNALQNSTATFKFIMNGPPITNLFFTPYDFWIGYPQERDEILNFILDPNGDANQADKIPNVVWLSTDLHGIVISKDRVSIGPSQPVPEVVGGAIGMDPIFEELPASLIPLLPGLPGILTQITQFDIDRFNAAVLSVTDTPTPKATIDFYDRSNTIIQSVSFP